MASAAQNQGNPRPAPGTNPFSGAHTALVTPFRGGAVAWELGGQPKVRTGMGFVPSLEPSTTEFQ